MNVTGRLRALERLRRVQRRTPLRVKLVAAMLVLLVVALAGSGIAARATLRNYLVGKVDDNLRSVAQHSQGGDGGQHDGPNGLGDGDTTTRTCPARSSSR